MSSSSKAPLLSGTITGATSNVKGGKFSLPTNSKDLILEIKVTRRTAGSITALVEHSLDGVTWYTLVTFTAAIAAVSSELKFPTTSNGGFIRVSTSSAAATDLDVAIDCWYNPARG